MTYKIQIIANYLQGIEANLRQRNILVDNIIYSINPLSMVDDPDISITHYCDTINDAVAVLDIKKNFDKMLSHDPDKFESNLNLQSVGQGIRHCNSSDYIFVVNNQLNYPLIEYNDRLYSDRWPKNEFTKFVMNNKTNLLNIPYSKKFNWKYYMDKFINIILSEYQSDHIIFMPTMVSQWYTANNEIKSFENDYSDCRDFTEKMDQYFISKTGCIVIDDYMKSVPHMERVCNAPFAIRPENVLDNIAESISRVINDPSNQNQAYERKVFINECLNTVYYKLTKSAKIKYIDELNQMDKEGIHLFDRKKDNSSDFIKHMSILRHVFDENKTFHLSDMVLKGSQGCDVSDNKDCEAFDIVELYTRYIRCDISDIIAVYKLYEQDPLAHDYNKIVSNLLKQEDCAAISDAKKRFNDNIDFLGSYEYISPNLNLIQKINSVAVSINDELYIVLSENPETPITLVLLEANDYSFDQIVDKMSCSFKSMRNIAEDLSFYIARAKNGLGNSPITVEYESKNEFWNSLQMVDYKHILINEPFVLKRKGEEYAPTNYNVICDLSFLFDKKTRIFGFIGGLADQMCHYLFAKHIEINNDCNIYYDDIFYRNYAQHNGLEINRYVKEDFSAKLLTAKFSQMLISKNFNNIYLLADTLYEAGVKNLSSTIIVESYLSKYIKQCDCRIYRSKDVDKIKELDCGPMYYFCRPDPFYTTDVYNNIEFPEYDTDANIKLAEDMLSCDAIVIHCRRGDYVTLGWEADMDYYKESMEKLRSIDDYKNKKFYIFSDDITWCRNNITEFGFEENCNNQIVFVDHNHGESSFRDLQLMLLGKVIIASNSGFVRLAAVLSKRCEVFMCYHQDVVKHRERLIAKNKYEIGKYKKHYTTNYLSQSPQKS